MNDDILELKIFVNKSKLRFEVLKNLGKEPQIAVFLSKKLDKHRSVISQVFLDLSEKGLCECINPEQDRYRRYVLTDLGKVVLKSFD
ncbi:MAG: hypothetical protein KC589_03815 [Nanoarchaeota archaeon]|nr:hypothetical protein [Nanoarchaeota archaeon]